jgi:hypothetical protein
VDQARLGEALYRLEHRHGDGSWASLEPRSSPHDPAATDPEASWADGQVYACPRCDEQVRVRYPPPGGGVHSNEG